MSNALSSIGVVAMPLPLFRVFLAILFTVALASVSLGQQYAITDLGTLPAFTYRSEAYGINNLGQVTGDSEDGSIDGADPFLYSGGTMRDLGALPGCWENYANSVNDSAQVVGFCGCEYWTWGYSHAFLL